MSENQQSDEDAPELPSHAPLPLPPEVDYVRPRSARDAAVGAPPGKSDAGRRSDDSYGIASHGAGLAAGTTFVVSIIAGATLGSWIDGRWNHTSIPWATLVMTVIGAAAGLLNVQRIMSRENKNKR